MAFTFFFRDTQTLELAVKHLIPCVTGRSRIRIWDAGCAMGPEPYTLAILLSENMGNFSFKNLYILATDIDESGLFGNIIREGIYSEEETKRIPKEIFDKYFQKINHNTNLYKIIDPIREKIHYQQHDLLSLQSAGDGFSLILCKNVLLHFQPAERIEVIKMFHRSLAPGGILAIENTQKLPDEVAHMFTRLVPDAQVYQKEEVNE